jgi:hypothetical protein
MDMDISHKPDDHCRDTNWLWDSWQQDEDTSINYQTQNESQQDTILREAVNESKPTSINTSFYRLCRDKGIPMELHELYYRWLITVQIGGQNVAHEHELPEDIHNKSQFVKPGMKIPPPTGQIWEDMMRDKNLKHSKFNQQHIISANRALVESQLHCYQMTQIVRDMSTNKEVTHAHKAKKTRTKAVAAEDTQTLPKGIVSALRHEDTKEAYKWLDSINKEWDGLCELGVFEHNCTRRKLRQAGIHTDPVPFSICLTYKYDKHGNIDRYKTRFALAGHSGNLQKGIHFDKTFSSTPNQHTSRILQAMMVKEKMKRMAMDIKMAYCNADMPNDQLIAVRYPSGFTRTDAETGEELYMILRKNLYGHPTAGMHWEQERNKVIMETFNTRDRLWTCKRCIKDPCLFVIKRTVDKTVRRIYMLIHTDDIDMIGDEQEDLKDIYARLSKKWECKVVDPSYVLGVRRTITWNSDVMTCELTMEAFVQGMHNSFSEYMDKRAVYTPMPDNCYIYLNPKTTQHESDRVLDRGYQRLFGMLL